MFKHFYVLLVCLIAVFQSARSNSPQDACKKEEILYYENYTIMKETFMHPWDRQVVYFGGDSDGRLSSLTMEVQDCVAVGLGTMVFVHGGKDSLGDRDAGVLLDTTTGNWRYDVPINSTSLRPSLRQDHSAVTNGTSAFIFGGNQNEFDLWRYDVDVGYTQLASIPNITGRKDTVGAMIGSKLYVLGGIDKLAGVVKNDVYQYDVDTDNWTLLWDIDTATCGEGQCPVAREDGAASHSRLGPILIGGEGVDSASLLDDVWLFNLETNTWTELFVGQLKPPSSEDTVLVTSSDGNFIYQNGGITGTSEYVTSVWVLNMTSDLIAEWYWTEVLQMSPYPEKKDHCGAFVGNKLYMIGGETPYESRTNRVFEYSVGVCPNSCVGYGKCVDGTCICDDGAAGIDCNTILRKLLIISDQTKTIARLITSMILLFTIFLYVLLLRNRHKTHIKAGNISMMVMTLIANAIGTVSVYLRIAQSYSVDEVDLITPYSCYGEYTLMLLSIGMTIGAMLSKSIILRRLFDIQNLVAKLNAKPQIMQASILESLYVVLAEVLLISIWFANDPLEVKQKQLNRDYTLICTSNNIDLYIKLVVCLNVFMLMICAIINYQTRHLRYFTDTKAFNYAIYSLMMVTMLSFSIHRSLEISNIDGKLLLHVGTMCTYIFTVQFFLIVPRIYYRNISKEEHTEVVRNFLSRATTSNSVAPTRPISYDADKQGGRTNTHEEELFQSSVIETKAGDISES